MLFMSALFELNGFNRLLGLSHVIWWTPLVIYLLRRLSGAGFLARGLLFGASPFTSSDAVRYIWDGRVVLAGLDPYRIAPIIAAAVLPAGWPLPAVHADIPTIYPPGAIGLFTACASFGPGWDPWAWKAVVLCASILTVTLMANALRTAQAERHLPLVALSPLLILEGGVGAHLDIITTLSIAGAIVLAQRRRAALTGAVLGLGALVKFLPAVAVVPLAAASGCFSRTGSSVRRSRRCGRRLGYQGWSQYCALRRRAGPRLDCPERTQRQMGEMPAACIGVATVGELGVFPWYLAAIIPALALSPSAFLLAWVTVPPVSYEVIDRVDLLGVWQPAAWPVWVVGLAWVVGLSADLVLMLRACMIRWTISSRCASNER